MTEIDAKSNFDTRIRPTVSPQETVMYDGGLNTPPPTPTPQTADVFIPPADIPSPNVKPRKQTIPQYRVEWLSGFITLCLLFFTALLLLGIGSQMLYYYSVIASLPTAMQWLFCAGGSICLLIILVVLCKIGILWFQIKTNNITMLLEKRQYLQETATDQERIAYAREKIKEWLREFNFNEEYTTKTLFGKKKIGSDKQIFLALGMEEVDILKLDAARNELLQRDKPPIDWLRDFQDRFQSKLDDLAKQRITAYYYKVMWGTAISPRAMVDQLIVILACASMIHDLLRIYKLKPAPGQSLFLLAHAFFNVYASGEMQDKTRYVADNIEDLTKKGFEHIKGDLLNVAGPTLFAGLPIIGRSLLFLTTKFAEGSINAMLIWNLGRTIVKWVQPTTPPK